MTDHRHPWFDVVYRSPEGRTTSIIVIAPDETRARWSALRRRRRYGLGELISITPRDGTTPPPPATKTDRRECETCGVAIVRVPGRPGPVSRWCDAHRPHEALGGRARVEAAVREGRLCTCGAIIRRGPGGATADACARCEVGHAARRAEERGGVEPTVAASRVFHLGVPVRFESEFGQRLEAALAGTERALVRAKRVGLTFTDREAASPASRARATLRWDEA